MLRNLLLDLLLLDLLRNRLLELLLLNLLLELRLQNRLLELRLLLSLLLRQKKDVIEVFVARLDSKLTEFTGSGRQI